VTAREAWETSERAAFVTIKTGGPLNGQVTITAVPNGGGRNRVEASWIDARGRHAQALEAPSYRFARAFAYAAANQLSLGNPPRLARD
jgi:hypothetical protein